MGKSWLMINLMMQDIENGHGVFFLDPHGDTIADLITYCSSLSMYDRCLLLDPENEDYSFGINLLECRTPASMKARNDTFTKAKGFFDKLWKNTFEEKPWLQMILQNAIYAFIENHGYTLVDLPVFFRDRAFRDHIVRSMR